MDMYMAKAATSINRIHSMKRNMTPYSFLVFVALFALASCGSSDATTVQSSSSDLDDLPQDTGGIQSSHPLGDTDSPFGYLIYEPAGSNTNSYQYPLLIFLHGIGEFSSSSDPIQALSAAARGAVPRMIENGSWNSPVPMFVASPEGGSNLWDVAPNPQNIRAFIRFLIKTYPIDPERVYLTGFSMGAFGVFHYLAEYGDSSGVAAAIPISGGGTASIGRKIRVPIWAFHGDADNTITLQGDLDMIDSINAGNPQIPAKITVLPGIGHPNITQPVYTASAMGTESKEYAPFAESIFTWMFRYRFSGQ